MSIISKREKYILITTVVVVSAFFIIREIVIFKRLSKNTRYTIGIIKKVSSSVDGGPVADFNYSVAGKKFDKLAGIAAEETINENDSFIVEYNTHYPGTCKLLTKYPIIGKIVTNDTGWKSVSELLKAIGK